MNDEHRVGKTKKTKNKNKKQKLLLLPLWAPWVNC